MIQRVGEVVGHVLGPDVDAAELRARQLRLRLGDGAFVVIGVVEGQRVRAERPR